MRLLAAQEELPPPRFPGEGIAASRWYSIWVKPVSRKAKVAGGKYDVVARLFLDNMSVPLEGPDIARIVRGSVNVVLVQTSKKRNMLQVIKEAAQAKLFPAQVEHLLAFGARYPREQLHGPIVAFGSQINVRGLWYVPCLDVVREVRKVWYNPWGSVTETKRRLTIMPRQVAVQGGKKPVLWAPEVRMLFVDQ